MVEKSTQISLNIGYNKNAVFIQDTRTVYFTTRHRVGLECKVPEDWGLTRVFQFMESLIKADNTLI